MIPTARLWAHNSLRRTIPYSRGSPQASSNATSQLQFYMRLRLGLRARPHVTKAQQLPEQNKVIPTPTTWLWLEPVARPFRAYGKVQQRRPYMTQFVSALVIYFVGDLVAQGIGAGSEPIVKVMDTDAEEEIGWAQAWVENRDWHRTCRALFIGGLAAVPGYRWFLWLGNNFNYRSKVLSLATKVLVNQTLFTPFFNTYFFGMHSLLSGASLSETATRIQNTVPVSVLNSCKFWPAVTAFMFWAVPVQYRNIFGGSIAIGWQAYLSLLNQRAAKKEGGEETVVEERIVVRRVQEMDKGERQKCAA